jgi:hypothetical protein
MITHNRPSSYSTRSTLSINKAILSIISIIISSAPNRNLDHPSIRLRIASTMAFMKTILALSLSAFALAVPLAQAQGDNLTVRIAGGST